MLRTYFIMQKTKPVFFSKFILHKNEKFFILRNKISYSQTMNCDLLVLADNTINDLINDKSMEFSHAFAQSGSSQ